MAEEHQVEARIQLRYDTYENWMNSSTILKTGEAAICAFEQDRVIDDLSNSTPQNTPPAIGIKIGNGQRRFSELPWVQGIAADVYNWAKREKKPTYTAQEIQGLQNFVESLVQGDVDITVASRIYSLVKGSDENANKWYLRYKENDENASWIVDTSAAIDLTDLTTLVDWVGRTNLEEYTFLDRIQERIQYFLAQLKNTDAAKKHYFVTAVSEKNGIVSVERAKPDFEDLTGVVTVAQGGTGVTDIPANCVLVGNGTNAITTRSIAEEITNNDDLVPNRLIKKYVDNAVAGLTGAMHFIGEATVNPGSGLDPQIPDYNFAQAQPGDVILYNYQEFVWDGSSWHLLGDEGSYILQGTVKDSDIIADANIEQSKIYHLIEDLAQKVDKVEGKVLSSNDYTNEEKEKLSNIENNAQVNTIEHVFLNNKEIPITSVTANEDTYPKSINIQLTEYTDQEKQKLAGIEAGAEVNKIESISVNGVNQQPESGNVEITIPNHKEHENIIEKIAINNHDLTPDEDKRVNIQIDESAVTFQVLKGAVFPTGELPPNPEYRSIDINANNQIVLAPIAATGSIYDVNNTTFSWDNYLILRCGNATNLVN